MSMSQAERDAEDARDAREKPMRDWKREMSDSDRYMTRAVEDLIDALSASVKSKIAKETMDKYNEKQQIRARKPK